MAASPRPQSDVGAVTTLIDRANAGDEAARNALFEALYVELHDLARARLRRHARFTLLDTTALLHESYLRLVHAGRLDVASREHFLCYAARTMRSIIVDFARANLAQRRGGGLPNLTLDTADAQAAPDAELEIVRVHDALGELAKADENLARVVEMRYFGGLTEKEVAKAMGVSDRTVRRNWEKARLLLSLALR